jgi:hypothetical protein
MRNVVSHLERRVRLMQGEVKLYLATRMGRSFRLFICFTSTCPNKTKVGMECSPNLHVYTTHGPHPTLLQHSPRTAGNNRAS